MPFDPLPNLTQEQLNCLALADFIEESEKFDMCSWAMPHCGTAGCIAGHAGTLFKLRGGVNDDVDWMEAANVLGLTPEENDELFTPTSEDGVRDLADIDKHRAARVLRHFAYSGEVDWSV